MSFGPQTIIRPGATAIVGVVGPRGGPGTPGSPGATGPTPWAPPVIWQPSLVCVVGPPATYVTFGGGSYVCLGPHTAGTFSVDFAAGYWAQVSAPGANGAVWFVAAVAPPAALGNNGDLYLLSGSGDVYQKAGGSWGTPVANLKGAAGASGNTIQYGSGAPASGLGNNGDFYIDTTNFRLYGPKAGAWPGSYASLVGPSGSNGNTIQNGSGAPASGVGSNGDFYIDTANSRLYGPKAAGAWPSSYVSLVGPPGANGTGTGTVTVTGSTPVTGRLAAFSGPTSITDAGKSISDLALSSTTLTAGLGLTGGGDLTVSRSLALSWLVNAQNGTSYTVLATDGFKLVKFSNAAAVAVTLPQAGGSFPNGWGTSFLNLGAGTVTITPTTSMINGAASLTLTTGQSADVYSDGTNYFAAAGSAAASGSSGSGAPSATISTTSGTNVAAAAADKGKTYLLAGSATLSLPAAVQTPGWYAWVQKIDGNGVWTITPAGVTIDGRSSINMYTEGSYMIYWDAANGVFRTINRPRGWINIGTTTVSTAVASVAFSVGFSDTELRDMQFDGQNIVMASSDYPVARFTKNGTVQTSGYVYTTTDNNNPIAATAGAYIPICVGANTTAHFFIGIIYAFASTINQNYLGNSGGASDSAVIYGRQSTQAFPITALTIIGGAGANISSGVINQRGYRP